MKKIYFLEKKIAQVWAVTLSKTHLVVEASNTVTLRRNARFDVILTSVTIIKQGFHSQIVML